MSSCEHTILIFIFFFVATLLGFGWGWFLAWVKYDKGY